MGNKVDIEQMRDKLDKADKEFKSLETVYRVKDIVFPLSTKGAAIVDKKGKRVKLAGTNWSGGHLGRQCVTGLECRPIQDLIKDMRDKFKLNCIRLTYSLQLFYDNNTVPQKYLIANPHLKGKTTIEIFDYVINKLTQMGMMVILNNHTSRSMWCCSNEDGDGLWWSREYPEYMFFENSQWLAKRYKNNQRVIGIDLRNQLRSAHGQSQEWGKGHPRVDWKRAAKICAEKVLKIAPHWLIFVGGKNYQTQLDCVYDSPLQLSVPNKLVYTGHIYSWSYHGTSQLTYQGFCRKFIEKQTFVRGLGYPYLLGQFGQNNKNQYWNFLMRYLKETDIDFTQWCCDGFKGQRNDDETYGLFCNDFSQDRHPHLLGDILAIACKDK